MPSLPDTLHLCFGEAYDDLLSHHEVFAQHRFPFRGGQVTLFVIGASSIVLVETGGTRLAEMIACRPSRRGLASFCETGLPLRSDSQGHVLHNSGKYRYSGEIQGEALSPHVGFSDVRLVQCLSHRFPSPGEPLTAIEAGEIEPGCLIVRTVHEYPEHDVRVLSRSRWEFS
jgi:hypothetical protein